MIDIKVEDYCQECDGFDPVVDTRLQNIMGEAKVTLVICSNRRRCNAMYNHILREFNKTKEN